MVACLDCGTELTAISQIEYRCPNPGCPGGAERFLCGFCRQPSFSQHLRRCTNPACRTHGVVREICSHCQSYSLVNLGGASLCINRRCEVNAGRVGTCPSCGTESRIDTGHGQVCVKSSCPDLFQVQGAPPPAEVPLGEMMTLMPGAPVRAPVRAPAPAPVPAPVPTPAAVTPPAPPAPAAVESPSAVGLHHHVERHTLAGSIPHAPSAAAAPAAPLAPPAPAAPPAPPQLQAPAAPPAAGNAPRPAATSPQAGAEIERAFAFVQEAVLADEHGSPAPIILVFGLSGSGKSTYLTMLGEVLAHGAGKYHFPCPGVTVRSLQLDKLIDTHRNGADAAERAMLHRRVRDLTYDFAERHHRDFLANGAWVPATVRETGGGAGGDAHSFFLITELMRNNAPFGRIVTIETSGEDYAEVLSRMGTVRDPAELASPLHRVLYRLLDAATGIIVLLDPAAHDNDQVYAGFLRLLHDAVEGRAAHALAAQVDRRLAMASAATEAASLDDALERERQAQAAQQREGEERAAFGSRLQEFSDELASAPRTVEGMTAFAVRWRSLLAELELLIGRIEPAFQERSAEQFRIHGRTASNYLLYYESILSLLRRPETFIQAVKLRIELADARQRETEAVIQRICDERSIEEPLHEAFIARWRERPPERRMEHLRYLAMVVTKADRHPIVYPPSDYPKFKLPACHGHLTRLQAYLILMGGHLRCYNATAIGYAVPRAGRYQPGPGNSFTPVNIVDPVLDMLIAEGHA